MVTITMEGEGDTVIEALYDLSLNVESAIEQVEAASDNTGAAEADGETDR